VPRQQAVEGVLGQWKAFIPIVFIPNILLLSDAQSAYEAQEAQEAQEAYEAYEAYEAQEPIFLKKDRLFLI
jgi:hypothetical protein